MVLNVQDAILLHTSWRMLFQFTIEREQVLDEQILRNIHNDHLCKLGQWLLSPAMYALRDCPEHEAIQRAHEIFHHEMSAVAALINQRRYAEATRAIAPHSLFGVASRTLVHLLEEFDRRHPSSGAEDMQLAEKL